MSSFLAVSDCKMPLFFPDRTRTIDRFSDDRMD